MSDLPTRDSLKRASVTLERAQPVLRDYVRGVLKTEMEWLATRQQPNYDMVREVLLDDGPEGIFVETDTSDLVVPLANAAHGIATTPCRCESHFTGPPHLLDPNHVPRWVSNHE